MKDMDSKLIDIVSCKTCKNMVLFVKYAILIRNDHQTAKTKGLYESIDRPAGWPNGTHPVEMGWGISIEMYPIISFLYSNKPVRNFGNGCVLTRTQNKSDSPKPLLTPLLYAPYFERPLPSWYFSCSSSYSPFHLNISYCGSNLNINLKLASSLLLLDSISQIVPNYVGIKFHPLTTYEWSANWKSASYSFALLMKFLSALTPVKWDK